MRRWTFYLILTLAVAIGTSGCGKSAASTVVLTISPVSASVITNTTLQFTPSVTGTSNLTVTWAIACATNVTAGACGAIDSNGLYTAPKTIPTTTSNGTTTIAPTATITATSQADNTKTGTATLTIVSGISVAVQPTTATIGTGEHFTFTATVNNPGCNTTTNPSCLNVTWSVPATLTGVGTIDANGVYTAPSAVPSPSVVTLTATSVADTAVTATTSVTVVSAVVPSVSAVSPSTAALGSLFEDVYVTGTNFISTNNVFVNGSQLSPSLVQQVSSTVIRARIPDFILASPPPSGFLQIGISQQTGAVQNCGDLSQCQVAVKGVRPALVGPTPNTISQGRAGVLSFDVDGGFFGTSTNPAVSATFGGQLRAINGQPSGSAHSTRQLSVTIGGSSNSADFTTPGLYPVAVRSALDATKFATANLAVQPNYNVTSLTTIAARIAVGNGPSAVAINPATGMAVVADTGSNDVTLVDLTASAPTVLATVCTASVGATAPCPSSGPTSVSVDSVRNIALVANTATKTIAVVDLTSKAVTFVTAPLQDSPGAVGINPVTGRALVAMQQRNYGILMDVTQNPPAIIGLVSISTGPNTRVAVEPHLNWAIATPGLAGAVGIVDLNRQSTNTITALSRTTNVVTVSVQASSTAVPQSPLAVQPGDAVLIQVSPDTNHFAGIYTVSAIGPGPTQFTYTQTAGALPDVPSAAASGSVNYSSPVATLGLSTAVQGIGINTETQQAVLVDPTSNGSVSFFSLIDQSVVGLQLATNGALEPGATAGAFNSLTNSAVVVNPANNTLSVLDPTTPTRLNEGNLYQLIPGPASRPIGIAIDEGTNLAVVTNNADNSITVLSLGAIQPLSITESSPKVFVANSTLTSAPVPSALTLTILGRGFSTGSPVARLDGISLSTNVVSDRKLTAIVPPSLLSSARRFALDVQISGGTLTNAEDFTVQQSIDVTGCSATPFPSGVAIDAQQNIAAVTLNGCNSLALINLSNGTGQTVPVGNSPLGVAVNPRLHLAAVANNGDGTASIVDEQGPSVTNTIATGTGPMGVAADQDTGEFAVANSVANTVSILSAQGATHSITTGQRPIAVAFNYQNHQVAIATTGATSFNTGSVNFADAAGSAASSSFSVNTPTSLVYDPFAGDCPANNTVGCFLANSSTNNNAVILDPTTSSETQFRIGINPTAIAYNYLTSTLVSTNTLSHTVTVADFLAQRIRAVLTLPAAPAISNLAFNGALQFGLDVHPLTNLAVIADTANGRVLFIPLPR